MKIVSKRIAAVIAVAGLGTAGAAAPASAQTAQQQMAAQQFQQQLQQQQQQQQAQQLQDQLRQQAEQQAQQQQQAAQQQQAWQQQAALQQQQQQQQWLQQQQAYNYGYGYYGGVNPTLLGLAFWTGQPYTHWACELGVDFQCPATRDAARAAYTTAAPDAPAAAPTYRHRSRHVRHRASEARAASR